MKDFFSKIGEIINGIFFNLGISFVGLIIVVFFLLLLIPILWVLHINPRIIVRLLRKEVTYIVVYVVSFIMNVFTRSEPIMVLQPVKIKEKESPEI